MKTKMRWTVWGTILAASLGGFTASLQAKDALGRVEKSTKIIGTDVRNVSDQHIGRVDDLVVDLQSGRILYAVVSVGGFLGVGDRLVAVPASALKEHGKGLELDADKQKLTDAPEFVKDRDRRSEMTSSDFIGKDYKYFGQTAWWEGASAPATGAASAAQRFANAQLASDLPSTDVKDTSGQKIGDVDNVMVDLPASRVVYVIFAPDSNLDLKNNYYALPPSALTPAPDRKSLSANITREKLAAAPSFDKSNWPDMSNPSWASRVYQYYGAQTYFDTGTLRPTSERTNSQERIYREPIQQ
jgi:sporulation protein YlmC with PRC-barrel domain